MDAAAFVLVWALAGQAADSSNLPDDIPAAPRRGAGATAIDRDDDIPPADDRAAKQPAGQARQPAAAQAIDDDIPVRRPFPRRQPIDDQEPGVRGQPKPANEAATEETLPSPDRSKTQPGAKHPDDEPIRVPLRTRVPVDPRTEPATAADAASRDRLEQTAPPARQNNIAPNDEDLRRARAAEDPTSPPELLSQALVPPKSGALEGRPISLGEALARRADRESQLRITHAYWKLAVATAAYHYAVSENARVWDVQAPRRDDAALVNSIRAAAKAKVHEAQLVALTSQHELSDLLGLGTGAALPLVYDPPHAGAYATRLDELFAGRAVPVRMRQIHGTLPALRQAIQARAQAVFEANQAFEAAQTGLANGGARVEDWLARLNHLGQQRQALLAVVRAYNDDIADYALTVAQAGTPAADLVPMLIRPRQTVAIKTRVSLNEQPTPAQQPLPARTADGFRPRN
jgi:hypothetical protein